MKKFTQTLPALLLSCLLVIITLSVRAQDSTATSETATTTVTNTKPMMWYMHPWTWVLGGIILLTIIFFAMGGGKNRRDPVTGEEDSVILPDRDTI